MDLNASNWECSLSLRAKNTGSGFSGPRMKYWLIVLGNLLCLLNCGQLICGIFRLYLKRTDKPRACAGGRLIAF